MPDDSRTQKLAELRVGAVVRSHDHAELGRIQELWQGFFRIDVRLARDYWLSEIDIDDIADDVVTVSFASSELDAMRLDPHRMETAVDDPGRYDRDPRERLEWLLKERGHA